MKYTHILWDFNGTLLDDVETGVININTLLKRRGLPLVRDKEHYRSIFTFPITEYYQNAGFDFSREPFEKIAPEWIEVNQVNIKNAPLYPDAIKALQFFKSKNIGQTIISATKKDLLCGHIKDLMIYDYFDEILGLDNIRAESKSHIGIEWKQRNPQKEPILIGDTLHDAEVARDIGCDCVLVCSGHQNRQTLEKTGLPVFNNLSEVIDYLW